MPITYYQKRVLARSFIGDSSSYDYLYFGLSTTEPTEEGTNVTELEDENYERVAVENTDDFWVEFSTVPGKYYNSETIEFPALEADAEGVVAIVIYDAETDGNLLSYMIVESIDFAAEETPTIAECAIEVTF